jgi:hypothetical protein
MAAEKPIAKKNVARIAAKEKAVKWEKSNSKKWWQAAKETSAKGNGVDFRGKDSCKRKRKHNRWGSEPVPQFLLFVGTRVHPILPAPMYIG